MKKLFLTVLNLLFIVLLVPHSFGQSFGFQKALKEQSNELMPFCLDYTSDNLALCQREGITVKFHSKNFLFIQATPEWIQEKTLSGELPQFFFENRPPSLLADTARIVHKVDQVHQGVGLPQAYTGKNVLIGFVDTGVDYRHPDFLDSLGRTRVLRYWDHNLNGPNSPQPYNYGAEFDSSAMNAGTIPSNLVGSIHGSSVVGIATGNGKANGSNLGMAPDANIVMVHTNFNIPNWTSSVADACDYIFKIADQYNMPAVINLSVGDYFGSHDGNDPASEYMEQLLDEKPGRIIVAAAGNSGGIGKYHVHGTATADTSFTWLLNNANGAYGANKIFFDFWADTSVMDDISFGFAADHSTNYTLRGKTGMRLLNANFPSTVIDTIRNASGNRIATVQCFRQIEGPNFHMEVLFNNVDSTSYLYRFMTEGSGEFDFWSGAAFGLNQIVENIPSVVQMPKIIDYTLPDLNQSIVSSWNCSEKVVTVGNARNRFGHVDRNGNNYTPANYPSAVGQLSPSSSKGPSRRGVIKPDVTAGGDVTLAAGPLDFLSNPANYPSIDSGGWHLRNGGTSMASPVVAGIAALYLERCPRGTYSSFLNLLHSTADKDIYTGATNNNSYGYGKADGIEILQSVAIEPSPSITQNNSILTASASPNYQWLQNSVEMNGETNQTLAIVPPNAVYNVYTVSQDGCVSTSTDYQSNLGIQELTASSLLVIPNPTNGVFTLKTEGKIVGVSCHDVNGKEMSIQSLGGNQYDSQYLPAGLYYLTVKTENSVLYLKMMRNN